jgi:hypothetical protein
MVTATKSASPLNKWLIFQYQVKSQHTSLFAIAVLCFTFIGPMNAEQSPAERVAEITAA